MVGPRKGADEQYDITGTGEDSSIACAVIRRQTRCGPGQNDGDDHDDASDQDERDPGVTIPRPAIITTNFCRALEGAVAVVRARLR